MKNKKNLILIVISIVLVVIALILVLTRQSGTMSKKEKSFAVEDTTAIKKIFLADSDGNTVLLQRDEQKGWTVNQNYEVMPNNIEDLLNCIANLTVKSPIAKTARENINKRMATGSVKVEIFYDDYHIKIGRLHVWKYTHKKVYYIGQQTMDNLGNYALLEGAKYPCVVYLPGFRGFVRPKYSPLEDAWRTHNIVKLKMSKIKRVDITDFENADQSFSIVKGSGRHFDIYATQTGEKLPAYDTLKLLDHLSDYRNLNYEMQEMELSEQEKDSILTNNKFKEISITDVDGNTTTITMFRINTILNTEEYDYNMAFVDAFNRDKFYAIVNGNKNELFLCQFFVFDRIVQPLSYYIPGNEARAIPSLREIKN